MKRHFFEILGLIWVISLIFLAPAYGLDSYPLYLKEIGIAGVTYDGIAISGDYLFASTFTRIIVFDISQPSAPQEISSWDEILTRAIAVSGNVLYLAKDTVVTIMDISDVSAPALISEVHLSGVTCDDIKINGNYLFIPVFNVIDVIDVSDPAHPVKINSIDTPGDPARIEIKGNLAIVADTYCFTLMDITDPLNVQITSVIRPPQDCIDVAFCGDFALYTAYGDFTEDPNLCVVDISNAYNARIISGLRIDGLLTYLVSSNQFAYIYDENDFLHVVDLSNPYSPHVVAMSAGFSVAEIKLKDNILFAQTNYLTLNVLSPTCTNIAGDANGDGHFNGLDIVYDVNFLKGTGYPVCPTYCDGFTSPVYREADANGNCQFNGIDITYAINFLKGGPPLPEICPDCPE